jgi:hypothetical protein
MQVVFPTTLAISLGSLSLGLALATSIASAQSWAAGEDPFTAKVCSELLISNDLQAGGSKAGRFPFALFKQLNPLFNLKKVDLKPCSDPSRS